MRKVNTIALVVIIISLIHNSFLFRISVFLSNTPSLIPYGGFFILSYIYILCSFYRKNNIDYKRLRISILVMSVILLVGALKEILYSDYSILDNLLFRFVFLYFILLIYPLKKLNIDKIAFLNIFKKYLFLNLILGICQAILDVPILMTEYRTIPFVNTIFYNSEYSTKYSYLLDYDGQVRAFGFFDSGLSFGIFMIFLFWIVFFEKTKNIYIKNASLFLTIIAIYLSYTKNVYVIFVCSIIIVCIQYFFKKINFNYIFFIQMGLLILATLFIDIFMYVGSLLGSFGVSISTFQSRGKLSREAIELLDNPIKILTGVPVDNSIIIDNDLLYLLIQGGVLLLVMCFVIVYQTFIESRNQMLKVDGKGNNPLHNAVFVIILTYFIGGTANYLFGIYSVIIFVYLCYLKGEFKPRVLLYSLYPKNLANLEKYHNDNSLKEEVSLVVYRNNRKEIEVLKKIYIKIFKPYDVVISDYPTRLLQSAKLFSISMGHGTAMKKFPSDQEIEDPKNFKLISTIKKSDYYIVTSDNQKELEMRAPRLDAINRSKYLSLGLPKNDGLFREKNKEIERKKQITILYAPTFRDYEETKLTTEFVKSLNKFLKVHNVLLIYQPHPFKPNINFSEVSLEERNMIKESKDFNFTEDEMLNYVDLLISDYSSISLKYLILEKPIIFFLYDYKEYEKERGIDFDFEDARLSPGVVSKTTEDLLLQLKCFLDGDFDNEYWKTRRINCLNYHYKYPDEYASRRIWNLIECRFKGEYYSEDTSIISNKK